MVVSRGGWVAVLLYIGVYPDGCVKGWMGCCVALYRGVPRWLCQGVDGLLYIGVYPDGCVKGWMGCCFI